LLIDPIVALLTLSGFILLGYGLYRTLHLRASELGKNLARLSIESNQKITEVLKTYREAVSQNRRYVYSREVAEIRMKHAEALAEISFMPNISKYIVESAMIVGVLIISAFQFVSQDSKQAVATLAVFLAAGTRIAPSVLRIQQGLLTVKTSIGSSKDTLDLMRSLKDTVGFPSASSTPNFDHVGFDAKLKINALNFKYRNGREEVIKDINLSLEKGKVLAVVGPSGAGKSTLADLILGALMPNSGSIRISGETPLRAAEMWPGALSYVPQEVVIIQGTLRDNIMLGYEKVKIYDEQVLKCIDRANLSDLLKNLPHGLDSEVGDSGYQLSGGQKQRLGIARALFTNPSFLVLDEATSALDSQSEREISDSIRSLREHTTIIIIAHRLSTVRDADIAIYLNNGRIEAIGSFEHLREKIQNFDKQAKLLGI
jgi:ABC-type multidrug transport system fused ATPase/permease subunit